jgi:hypothetical protein
LEDQILSNVLVKINNLESPHGLKVKGSIPLHEEDQIKYNEKRYVYIILSNQDCTTPYPSVKISQKLVFKITEIDVESQDDLGSYDEEYEFKEDLSLSTKDYLKGFPIGQDKFKDAWENLGAQGNREGNLSELT